MKNLDSESVFVGLVVSMLTNSSNPKVQQQGKMIAGAFKSSEEDKHSVMFVVSSSFVADSEHDIFPAEAVRYLVQAGCAEMQNYQDHIASLQGAGVNPSSELESSYSKRLQSISDAITAFETSF